MIATSEYWDSRYAVDDGPTEWLQDYAGLKPLLWPLVRLTPDFEVLIIGCGNSGAPVQTLDFRRPTSVRDSNVFMRLCRIWCAALQGRRAERFQY
jgi:hypothetical protein